MFFLRRTRLNCGGINNSSSWWIFILRAIIFGMSFDTMIKFAFKYLHENFACHHFHFYFLPAKYQLAYSHRWFVLRFIHTKQKAPRFTKPSNSKFSHKNISWDYLCKLFRSFAFEFALAWCECTFKRKHMLHSHANLYSQLHELILLRFAIWLECPHGETDGLQVNGRKC